MISHETFIEDRNSLHSGLPKLKTVFTGAALALFALAVVAPPASGQVVGGYVQVNAFERKVTPSTVYKGEKFQGLLRGDATLLKDLPLNTNVEVEFVVKAKPATGQGEESVGKGVLKVGPLPSVKAGANVNMTETFELLFPESARPGTYNVVIEATSVKPFVIAMVIDLIIPGTQTLSLHLGQVQYMGERPVGDGIKLAITAPKEAMATANIDVEVEARVPGAQRLNLALYMQKGESEKTLLKEISVAGDGPVRERLTAPDYDGAIRVGAEIKDYMVGGAPVVPSPPQQRWVDVVLKRLPLQASGKVDSAGVVKQTFQATSPDSKATLRLPAGTKALSADRQAISELSIVADSVPAAKKGEWIVGRAYKLGPEGASFQPPIVLDITYDRSALPDSINEDTLAIATYSAAPGWTRLHSTVNKEKQTVSAAVAHFSVFAVTGEVQRPNAWLIGSMAAVAVVALFFGWRRFARR